MPRVDAVLAHTVGAQFNGAGTQSVIQTPSRVKYAIFIASDSDLYFSKSVDGGRSWTTPVVIFTGTCVGFAVWYDRYSGINADLIHVAYLESVTDDVLYRTIDTASSDTLSTQTVIFAGASTATVANISITRTVGGNVLCAFDMDGGTEKGLYRLPNANVPNGAWDAARFDLTEGADFLYLLPDFWSADNQDALVVFWDRSADTLSRKNYDDSANNVASETNFSTGMVEGAQATAFPHFDCAVDLANNQILMAAWSAVDTANADLRIWKFTNASITEMTNVVLNSVDDQGLVAIAVDIDRPNHWVVAYTGKANGSQTWNTAVGIYAKETFDGGTTWGPEETITELPITGAGAAVHQIVSSSRFYGAPTYIWYSNAAVLDMLYANSLIASPQEARMQVLN